MRRLLLAVLLLAGVAVPASADPLPPLLPPIPATQPAEAFSAAAGEDLVGLFEIKKGVCGATGVTSGSFFRMIQPGGNLQTGPFVENNDSPCANKSYTPLAPGTDGGLATSGYQPHPGQPFDALGNGLNAKITQPEKFFSTRFSTATNSADPQTTLNVVHPRITSSGGSLSGDVRSFAAAWNTQHFNQGSPKPDGSKPGNTSGPAGTYDPANKAYALDWSSLIVGGPFNNFTGTWHFEGTFRSGVRPPGTQTASAASVRGGRTRTRGERLAATGADLRPGAGAAFLALSAALLIAERRLRASNDT